nr:GATA transcription factor 8-like [Ipomoea batatas]
MDSNFVDEIDCGSFFDHIDDLIDFPPENECAGVGSGDCANFPSIWDEPLPDSDPIFSAAHSHSASDLSAELSVPYEDIVQLEWLSAFVEESFSDGGLTLGKENYPIIPKPAESDKKFQAASSPISVMPLSPSQRGAQRARSKRPRPVAFNPRPVMQLIETPQPESFADSPVKKVPRLPPAGAPEQKKKKKIKFSMPALPGGPDQNQAGAQPVRKCMHCEITKTPQWRAGPMGPKTLCNACGVRYKSGRLFPEYRPAASPTFVPALHSNSHKKVVEMRTKAVEQSPVSSLVAPTVTAPPEIK